MKKKGTLMCKYSILLIAGLLLSGVEMTVACSCIAPPPPKDALKKAAAVFAGKVAEIKIDEVKGVKQVTLEVSAFWKGVIGGQVEVSTAVHGSACGYGFQKGQAYLVYCYAKHNEGAPQKLWTSICNRTRPMARAAGDLKEIGKGDKTKGICQAALNERQVGQTGFETCSN